MNKEDIKEVLSENLERQIKSSDMPEGLASIIKNTANKMVDGQPAYNFVGVQPICGPVGVAFYMDYISKEVVEKENKNQPWLPCEIIPDSNIIADDGTEMVLAKRSQAVEAGTRGMAAQITVEAMEDQQVIDGDGLFAQRLLSDITTHINQEVYEEIRSDLSNLGFKETLELGEFIDADDMLSSDGVDKLTTKLQSISDEIGSRTRRGNGNFAIVSKTVATILKFTGNLEVDDKYIEQDYEFVTYVGTFRDGIKVYCDSGIEHNKLIIGYKDNDSEISQQDVGYVYLPYVQLMCLGPVEDPITLKSVMKFATRYAKAVNCKTEEFIETLEDGTEIPKSRAMSPFYCELTIDGLPKITINNTDIESLVVKIKETLLKNMAGTSSISNNDVNGEINDKFTKKLIPLIIDKLAAMNFVGVQPMTGPVSLLYCLEYKSEEEGRLSLNVVSRAIEAASRYYKDEISLEAQQDMNIGWHTAKDLENKIVTGIAKEIYEEMKTDIMRVAHKETMNVSEDTDPRGIVIGINRAAHEIARLTRRGAGNFVIVSPDFVKFLENNKLVKRDMNSINPAFDYEYVKYIGTLVGTIKVFVDDSMEYNKCIVGYKGGAGQTDCGCFYAPYKLLDANVRVNPETFQPLIKLSTRYGKCIIQKTTEITSEDGSETTIKREPCNYYQVITFNGMPKFKEGELFYYPNITEGIESEDDSFDESMKNIN